MPRSIVLRIAGRTSYWLRIIFVLGLLTVVGACEPGTDGAIEPGEADLRLTLDLPTRLASDEEGTLTVSLENRSTGATGDLEVQVVIPAWLEVLDPERADTMVEGPVGTRLTHRIGRGAIGRRETVTFEHAVRRVELAPDRTAQVGARVRAWLAMPDGRSLGDPVDARVPGAPRRARAPIEPEGVGPARLGAQIALLRENVEGVRDTVVHLGGQAHDALIVPIDDRSDVRAVAAGGVVIAVIIDTPRLRTLAGAGVGTTLARLEKLYGGGCLAAEDGAAVASFPILPGIHFRMDDEQAAPPSPVRIGADATAAESRVHEVWIRGIEPDC